MIMQEPIENDDAQHSDLHTENEIKKMKLALEHGMSLSDSFSNPDLPPEIEGQFLDYIQQWEDKYAQRKMISIYDLAGRPYFIPVNEISEKDIAAELNSILQILQQHSIALDTLCPVTDRELYRFVTEELMNEETEDIRIEGMMHCFTYEEYHPNHEYDVKNRCTEVIEYIISKEKDYTTAPWGLADNIVVGDDLLTKDELNKKITAFRDSFSLFTLHSFEYTFVRLNDAENAAEAAAVIRYSATIEDSNETMEYEGTCRFWLNCEYEWWTIHKFEMPMKGF
jgi:hypothetical protein